MGYESIPNPQDYDGPEFEGCPYNYNNVDEGDECIGCQWYELCKDHYDNECLEEVVNE